MSWQWSELGSHIWVQCLWCACCTQSPVHAALQPLLFHLEYWTRNSRQYKSEEQILSSWLCLFAEQLEILTKTEIYLFVTIFFLIDQSLDKKMPFYPLLSCTTLKQHTPLWHLFIPKSEKKWNFILYQTNTVCMHKAKGCTSFYFLCLVCIF